MRELLLAIFCCAISVPLLAQTNKEDLNEFNKNNIKINIFALPIRNFSLQYERGLNENISVAMGVSFLPKGAIPFKNTIKNSMDTEDIDSADAGLDFINNAQISSWSITPEFRYYFGKKPLNGFYIAPFVRIGGYSVDWNYKFERDNGGDKPVHLKGKSTALSGGILFGVQWHVGKHFLIDWWILGPQYGNFNLKLEANGDFSDLSDKEKQDLEKAIEGIGYQGNKFNATVTNNYVEAENKINLPGLRTGLCLSYTF